MAKLRGILWVWRSVNPQNKLILENFSYPHLPAALICLTVRDTPVGSTVRLQLDRLRVSSFLLGSLSSTRLDRLLLSRNRY